MQFKFISQAALYYESFYPKGRFAYLRRIQRHKGPLRWILAVSTPCYMNEFRLSTDAISLPRL